MKEEVVFETGRVEFIDLGEEVMVGFRGIYYKRNFSFEKDSVSGVFEDVLLNKVGFDSSGNYQRIIGEYDSDVGGRVYTVVVSLSDVLDLDGDASNDFYVKVREGSIDWEGCTILYECESDS